MAYGGHMAPTLAPPAGAWKWRDDEYWNKHEGLMTQTWPHHYESREKVKNKPITINARTLSQSAGNLPEMTMRPNARPATVPANMPSMGKRFLDNVDSYMGRNNGAPAQADSTASTPRRSRSTADKRSSSEANLGGRTTTGFKGWGAATAPQGQVVGLERSFRDNMYFYGAGMARAEPLQAREQERQSYGLPPSNKITALADRRRGGPGLVRKTGPGSTAAKSPSMGLPLQLNGIQVPYTNNQLYGARALEGERPSSAAENGRKMKTVSNVIMGM